MSDVSNVVSKPVSKQSVLLTQEKDFRFALVFGEHQPVVYGDEPPPLGGGTGPSPAQLLVAAVANCLSDSLLFALRKFKQAPDPLSTEASCEIGRNADGRLRVLRIDVHIRLGVAAATLSHLERVLEQFEAFCTVSQSVAPGVPIHVSVKDSEGLVLRESVL